MERYRKAVAKAEELGATVKNVIHWTWAKGFTNPQSGEQFVKWLDENEYNHGGYYRASPLKVV